MMHMMFGKSLRALGLVALFFGSPGPLDAESMAATQMPIVVARDQKPTRARLESNVLEIEKTLKAFGTNTTGGFSDTHGTEYTVRNIGKPASLDDIRSVVAAYRFGVPVLLSQIGEVAFVPKVKRGDGAFNGIPSVNLEIVKQPQANTVMVGDHIVALLDEMQQTAPPGVRLRQISYNQADMIKEAISNVGHMLRDAIIIVSIVLIVFTRDVDREGSACGRAVGIRA